MCKMAALCSFALLLCSGIPALAADSVFSCASTNGFGASNILHIDFTGQSVRGGFVANPERRYRANIGAEEVGWASADGHVHSLNRYSGDYVVFSSVPGYDWRAEFKCSPASQKPLIGPRM